MAKLTLSISDDSDYEPLISKEGIPFELNNIKIKDKEEINLEGTYYKFENELARLKSKIVEKDLIIKIGNEEIKWVNVNCKNNSNSPQIAGGILDGASRLKSRILNTSLETDKKNKKCSNKLEGPLGLKVNYLARDNYTNESYFAVIRYCFINFKKNITFLGIMSVKDENKEYSPLFGDFKSNLDAFLKILKNDKNFIKI